MAIANSDGSIVLTTKIDTGGVGKALDYIRNKFSALKGQKETITILTQAIKAQQIVVDNLNQEYKEFILQGEIGSKKAEELKKQIDEQTKELNELKALLGTLGKKGTKSFDDMSKGLKNFGKRIAGIMKSALIFSVIYKVLQGVVKLFKNVLMSDEQFQQDWEELKAAFYAAAYPIITLLVPAIKFIVQQVRDWAVSVGKIAAELQGMTYSELVEQAEASKKAADNYADMEKSSKKTADNVERQLASFDDIQILSSGNKEEQGADYMGFGALKEYDTSGEKSMLQSLMTAIGGALMAIGLILLFHGQIAWGIGFIIAGAFGITAATLANDSVSQKVKDELSNALLIVGVVAVLIGILLCMASMWGYGIALIALGVASIVAPVALNWNGIKQQLQTSFGGWLALGGVIAIVLGILLCFTPAIPLGIGLIVLGAGALVAPIVANWDAISNKIKEIFNAIVNWVKTYGLLVLGIILCLTGVGMSLGIALIIKWAKEGAENGVPLATAIVDKVKEIWGLIQAFWDRNIAPVFTTKFWLDLAKKCGNGLIAGFEGAINGIVTMFEKMINWIVDGLNKISFDVPDWVPLIGGKKFGFNISKVDFGQVKIPRLAQGAVIPPNRQFLAVLGDQKSGTNIETPLSTMIEAFNTALNIRGNDTVKEEHYYLDENEIMRIIYKLAKRGEQAQGADLLESW
jgi:hypothetical protein